jgi:hypothetical protein
LSPGADLVGVDDARIDGKKFRVAISVAEGLLRQLPEGIAVMDAHGFLRRSPNVIGSGLRLYRLNRCHGCCGLHGLPRGSRRHRLDVNARRRRSGRNSWLRGSDHPTMSPKCRTNFLTKVGMNIRTDDSQDIFANFGLSVVVNFGTNCWAIIFTGRCMGIGAYICMHFGTDIFPDGWTNFRAANF